MWDVIAEAGVCRLRGHRDMVSDVCLLQVHGAIASVAKDGMLRLWDLDTQHCVQVAAAPSGELWSVDADEACEMLITGGAGAEILAWQLESRALARQRPPAARQTEPSDGATDSEWRGVHARLLGALVVRVSTSRVSRLRYGLDGALLAVQFADKHLQLYGVQTPEQLKRQMKRRLSKRRKQAAEQEGSGIALDAEGIELGAADRFQPLSHVRAPSKLHSFAFLPRQKSAASALATA